MNSSWFEYRKDLFIRDIVRDCINARIFFNDLKTSFIETGNLPYEKLAPWIGTELKKGPLWYLKDQSHRLFRNSQSAVNPYEHLLDWGIGSIFHEAMKLKEDVYQVASYKPLLENQMSRYKDNKALSIIFSEYFSLIKKAKQNIGSEIKNIDELFTRTLNNLKMVLSGYASNIHLLRYLLDSRDVVESVFGEGSFQEILQSMYGDTITKPYVIAAEHCIQSGWYKAAQTYLREVLRADPQSQRFRELMKQAQAKLNACREKKDH
ncbi:MAG: hypothetical protein N3B18_04915 [Desulfobacterota bacterium]|nr:hypothetical protein [Thermodesulfobacteriota bacterium]